MQLKAPRGTQDILPKNIHKWHYVEEKFKEIASSYGFLEIRVPTFEYTELFLRGVGDTTDVVSKEMYTFLDKSDRSITLKPEGTASVVRSILESGLINDALPIKLSYNIPCFRYDKPQAGRLREFHQFGVECIGSSDSKSDVQVISLANDMLNSVNIKNVRLEINSIGCKHCRPTYNKLLFAFLESNSGKLCSTCNERLDKNPMRIIDCKNENCKNIVKNAPDCVEHLCEECDFHYKDLKNGLNLLNISYTENPKIVRGLDYYTKTVFEFISDSLGSQSTVCGGGRYDSLIELMGGKPQPAVGFAMGIERLILILENKNSEFKNPKTIDIYIANTDNESKDYSFKLASYLRNNGISTETDLLDRSLKSQMKYADKIKAKFTIVIGDDEINSNEFILRDMDSGKTITTTKETILNIILKTINS